MFYNGNKIAIEISILMMQYKNIDGIKTFREDAVFEMDVSCEQRITTDAFNIRSSGHMYIGNFTTDGSYRFFINTSGNLEIQKRESGSWNYKATF